jgi:hypothetical protein
MKLLRVTSGSDASDDLVQQWMEDARWCRFTLRMKSSEEETIWFWEMDLGMDDINKLGVGLIDACWIGGFVLVV